MKLKENDAYAFPMPASEFAGHGPDGGMSLRDYFAGKAMQIFEADSHTNVDWLAGKAYEVADAMLRERAK